MTGAGQGVGRAIALKFAAEGARVTVAERNPETAALVAREAEAFSHPILAVTCDVSVRDDVERAVADTVAANGGIDILVNNAHDLRDVNMPFTETTEEHLMRNLRSGLLGLFNFTQACHPYLRERRGVIINIAAAAGVRGGENYFSYASTKEGIRAATRVTARELGPDGIRVNAICPIALDSPAVIAHQERNGVTDSVAAMAAVSPLRRAVLGEDIANVALLLVSDEAAVITGHTIMADAGMNMDAGR